VEQVSDRLALVSDGSRGVGAAIVRELAADGWDITFCYRGDGQSARQVEKAASELGARVLALQVDVTDAAQVVSWFRRAQDEIGPVEAVVSCAGLARDRPLTMLAGQDWRTVLDTGLEGVFHLCRVAMFAMLERESGRIVAVTSVCDAYDHGDDVTARPGIGAFVKTLAAQGSRFGVTVNAVTPGLATHDMTAILPERPRPDVTETIALRRFGDAADVAGLVSFLLSEEACDITGNVLEVRSPISLLTRLFRDLRGVNRRVIWRVIVPGGQAKGAVHHEEIFSFSRRPGLGRPARGRERRVGECGPHAGGHFEQLHVNRFGRGGMRGRRIGQRADYGHGENDLEPER
jgi:3-oxoacyl-[acyl-carrier protein] reductase